MSKLQKQSEEIGVKYNLLTIIGDVHIIDGRSRVLVRCECGVEKIVPYSSIKSRRLKSCGKRIHHPSYKHGGTHDPIFKVWHSMINRCRFYRDGTPKSSVYGGRGITVCKEWMESYTTFKEWCVLHKWEKGLQIDRINNDGNYEPNNCRIVTVKENCRNKRTNKFFTYNGITKTCTDWAIQVGITTSSFLRRTEKMTIKEAIETPVNRIKQIVGGMCLIMVLLTSCGSSKHVQRSTTTVDSSVIQENKFLKESIAGLNHTIERLTLDSQAVIIEFDSVTIRDTFTRVVFKEGKIQTVQGPVRRVVQIDKRSTQERDSLAEVNSVLIDSVAYYKAQKAVKIETVDKKVTRWQWWLLVVGLVIAWIVRGYWPLVKERLFGITSSKKQYMLLGIFSGGLWIIPLLTLIGAIWFTHIAIQKREPEDGGPNIAWSKIGQAWFSAALYMATVIIVILMYNDR